MRASSITVSSGAGHHRPHHTRSARTFWSTEICQSSSSAVHVADGKIETCTNAEIGTFESKPCGKCGAKGNLYYGVPDFDTATITGVREFYAENTGMTDPDEVRVTFPDIEYEEWFPTGSHRIRGSPWPEGTEKPTEDEEGRDDERLPRPSMRTQIRIKVETSRGKLPTPYDTLIANRYPPQWHPAEVAIWAETNIFPHNAKIITKRDITGSMLLRLTRKKLKKLGFKDRTLVLEAIKELQTRVDAWVVPSDFVADFVAGAQRETDVESDGSSASNEDDDEESGPNEMYDSSPLPQTPPIQVRRRPSESSRKDSLNRQKSEQCRYCLGNGYDSDGDECEACVGTGKTRRSSRGVVD